MWFYRKFFQIRYGIWYYNLYMFYRKELFSIIVRDIECFRNIFYYIHTKAK